MSRHVLCNYIYPRLRIHQWTAIRCKSTQDHYANLKINSNASVKEIKAAYIKLTKEHHPDSNLNDNASHDEFVKINESYNVLIDLQKRQEYDQSKGYKRKPAGQSYHPNAGYQQNAYTNYQNAYTDYRSYEEKRREELRRKHNFDQFKKQRRNLSDLVDMGLVIGALLGCYVLIMATLSKTIGGVQQQKYTKYSKMYNDDIDKILEKGGKNWDEMDKWMAREYIAKHYKKDLKEGK